MTHEPNRILANLFRQNTWATLVVIDACLAADRAVVDAEAPETVGTIRETLWHMVDVEHHFLAALQGNPDASSLAALPIPDGDLAAIRSHIVSIGDALVAWAENVVGDPTLVGMWGHGPYRVPTSMFAVQAIHHRTTPRWQIAQALERLGVAAPYTDGWAWWDSGAAMGDAGSH